MMIHYETIKGKNYKLNIMQIWDNLSSDYKKLLQCNAYQKYWIAPASFYVLFHFIYLLLPLNQNSLTFAHKLH